ncbi:MAG: hypothetical protein ACXABY_14415 [Candidatus Thorarchaeota archaeon]|jgi:hypothetical protein
MYVEKKPGIVRIWYNRWAVTIRGGQKIRYNHAHDLTFCATRPVNGKPTCRNCGKIVPQHLIAQATLQQVGV